VNRRDQNKPGKICCRAFVFALVALILGACRAGGETPTPTEVISHTATVAAIQASPTEEGALVQPPASPTAQPTSTQVPLQGTPVDPTSSPPGMPTTTDSASPTAAATALPTQTGAATDPGPSQATCEEKAAFFDDVTVPDGTFFRQGEAFVKTWRFRNEGTCTWTTGYQLVFHSGEVLNAPLSMAFPRQVLPGEMVDLSLEMVAPARGGQFRSNWWFEDLDGVRFGTGSARADAFWTLIQVRFLDENDQPRPDPALQPPPAPQTGGCVQVDPVAQGTILGLINQARANNGLSLYSTNSALHAAAMAHSADMACQQFINHSGSDGSSWYDRIRAQGYQYSGASENIYAGNLAFGATAEEAVRWWMNSQVHRDNILRVNMSEVGIGYAYNPDNGFAYYTLVFARP
jgi:hypothetical protein